MTLSRRHFNNCLLAASMAPSLPPSLAHSKPLGEWRRLFDGKTLKGWTPKLRYCELGDNDRNTFQVKDGMIQVRYDKYDTFGERFGHLFFEESFSHYRLRLEYRFVGNQCKGGPGWALRNSGAMIHCQDPKSMTKDQDFPVSIEVQFLGGNGINPRTTGNLCTPGTHVVYKNKLHKTHCTDSTSKTFHGDQWVTAEIEAHGGGEIKHIINRETVLVYEMPQYDPGDNNAKPLIKGTNFVIKGGYISLQAESHPIDFRNIEIMPLER